MKLLVVLTLSINAAYAAGGDPHAGPGSLVSSFVNLGLLLGFLAWKLKGPLSNMFTNKSENVKSLIEKADAKAKEAEMMMQMQAKKMAGADAEVKKIAESTDEFISKFESTYKAEVEERIGYLKSDAENKIEAEKKQVVDTLNETLLEQVIANTKATLKNDSNLSSDVSKKLVEGLK